MGELLINLTILFHFKQIGDAIKVKIGNEVWTFK